MVGKLVSLGHWGPGDGAAWPSEMPGTGRLSRRPRESQRWRRLEQHVRQLRSARGQRHPAAIDDQGAAIRQPQRREHVVARLAVVRHVVEQKLMLRVVVALHPHAAVARQRADRALAQREGRGRELRELLRECARALGALPLPASEVHEQYHRRAGQQRHGPAGRPAEAAELERQRQGVFSVGALYFADWVGASTGAPRRPRILVQAGGYG